ncbi:MAG TPA: S8 family peptidase [Actinomycetota bacterium]|nr:S8 family peptidase [Actinomycetota bacterium]
MRTRSRILTSCAVIAAVLMAMAVAAPTASAAPRPKLPWQGPAVRVKPGRVIVTFAPETSGAERRAVHAEVGGRPTAPRGPLRVDVVDVPPGLPTSAALRRYRADPSVVAAEPDRLAVPTEIPNDPMFLAEQWALRNTGQNHLITESGFVPKDRARGLSDRDVDANTAWNTESGAADVVVAVLDSGVDIDHPDLVDAMWNNPDEVVNDGLDNDGNGKIDDVYGWDFLRDDRNPSPPNNLNASHGTHVAGIVAATRGNAKGIAGVCGSCRIMGLRFDLSLGQEIEAIEYAVAEHADVINMSFASPVWSAAERAAIEDAGHAGVLTVVAAANFSADNDVAFFPEDGFAPAYPASYTLRTILSVAASNHEDEYALVTECDLSTVPRWRCAFTSWGRDSVDVAAPGVDIMSTIAADLPGGAGTPGYAVFDGTSMAAPVVAGIAGMVKHAHPGYTPFQIKNAVMRSVDRPSSLKMLSSHANQTGMPTTPISGLFTRTQGRVNALKALTASTANATPLTDGNIDGAVFLSGTVQRSVAWPRDVNDVYRKRLFAGNRYRITLNGPAGKDMDLMVWRPGATEIHQFTAGCFFGGSCPWLRAVSGSPDADEQVTFSVAKTGTFYVQVQGWYSGGRYTLSVKRL